MKRFYETVSVSPVKLDAESPIYAQQSDAYALFLDKKLLKSPDKKPFCLPNLALAEAICQEWQAQTEKILPETMPLMGQAAKTVDWISLKTDLAYQEIIAYAETDLLCYQTDFPSSLALKQRASWQPILDWIAETFQAPLTVTYTVDAIPQPPESIAHLRHRVQSVSPWVLAALHSLTGVLGSACLALALTHNRISATQAYEASFLDELYQIEKWGEDAEANALRQKNHQEIKELKRYLSYVT